MKRECITCGKASDSRKGFWELAGRIGPKYICKECAMEMGIKNFMVAGFFSNTRALKKYVMLHPEAQFRLDQQMQRLSAYKQNLKAEREALKVKQNAEKEMAMPKEECFCCHEVSYKKECYKAGDVIVGGKYYCKKCAEQIGVRNRTSAIFWTKLNVLSKYAKIHPEIDKEYNTYLLQVIKRNQISNKEAEKAMLRAKSKEKTQEKYTCKSCGNVWYISDIDHLKNLYNATTLNFYTINQLKDVDRCPKCGSSATRMEKKKYWVDKKGNCVDVEE